MVTNKNDNRELVAQEDGLCRDIKAGRVTLYCTLPQGHEGWHQAKFQDHQEITYPGAHHVVDTMESVTWERVDHIREAVRHLKADRG